MIISTHDLAKRSTQRGGRSYKKSFKFQLTTSRRGRPLRSFARCLCSLHFNSRPREEVDVHFMGHLFRVRLISTHDLAKRSTAEWAEIQRFYNYFNSRPREEVDAEGSTWANRKDDFNSRPREEVDLLLLSSL